MMANVTLLQFKTGSKKNSFKCLRPILIFLSTFLILQHISKVLVTCQSKRRKRKIETSFQKMLLSSSISIHILPRIFKDLPLLPPPFTTICLAKILTFIYSHQSEMSPQMNTVIGTCQIWHCTSGSGDVAGKCIKKQLKFI